MKYIIVNIWWIYFQWPKSLFELRQPSIDVKSQSDNEIARPVKHFQ